MYAIILNKNENLTVLTAESQELACEAGYEFVKNHTKCNFYKAAILNVLKENAQWLDSDFNVKIVKAEKYLEFSLINN